ERFLPRPLEGVAAHDRAERAALRDLADFAEHLVRALGLAAREDDDALAVECTLHAMLHAVAEGLRRDAVLLEDLLRLGLLDVVLRRLDLDDVRAELRRDLRRVTADVDRGLAVLGDAGAARVGPDDGWKSNRFGLQDELAESFVHLVARARAGINRVADGRAAEA